MFTESDAVLRICQYLRWPWKIFVVFRLIPKAIRNQVYRWFARHRHRIFGEQKNCYLPSQEDRQRFLDRTNV
ncbi:DUF393 domain-containing protein [Bacillaceae bacterium SIJ1]|nr:DCC1-like thiol-disulfide oxidoreductase family protein [Litoribacterium kuwaitense]NGP46588.1 DUF393 domain-containing protein [Litoribacterium kuwaitense]